MVWFVLLGLPELALRLFWKPPVPKVPAVGTRAFLNWLSGLSQDEQNPQPLYQPDPKLLWSLEPDTQLTSFNHHFRPGGEKQPIRITINSDGYRGAKLNEADSTATRVLCLGDSNFFGYPLDDADTFPAVLEGTLNRHCPENRWMVINGGVPGYSVVQGWRWYQSKFQSKQFDVLLLSFLNNDAWRQPGRDLDLLTKASSPLQALGDLARNSRLVNWAESVSRPTVPKSKYVPRVSREEFIAHYRMLIDAARKAGTRVVILDYRAYLQYEQYSLALRALANEEQIGYVPVVERVAASLNDPSILQRYPAQAERIQRRWGAELLAERPDLWYFAEFHPEHLNELGVAWLADQLQESLCREHD